MSGRLLGETNSTLKAWTIISEHVPWVMGKMDIISNDHFVIQRLEEKFHQGCLLPQLLKNGALTGVENIQFDCTIVRGPCKENEWKKARIRMSENSEHDG